MFDCHRPGIRLRPGLARLGLVLMVVFWSLPLWAQEPTADKSVPSEHFRFGSYGRVVAGTDLDGGGARGPRVIAHAPRLLEASYAEIDFAYGQEVGEGGARFDTHLTLSLGEELFHFTGSFEAQVAIRNLYVETSRFGLGGLSLWIGSRMYRGDDVYLLDFWPLDEQNTVGGGVGYEWGETSVQLHVGVNRLDDSFQTQAILVGAQELGAREVLFMERQRTVTSLRAEHHLSLGDDLQLKLVAYGEGHALPRGVLREDDLDEEVLPADQGWLVGFQVGAHGFGPNAHANLFVRYGDGLGAYDEMAIPVGLNREKTASGAREILAGLSSNWEPTSSYGILVGAYTRYFVDADPNVYDRDDALEVGASVRPVWFVTDHLHLVVEGNFQYLRPNGLSPETAEHDKPMVVQLGLMPSISIGSGSYARPQLRLMYVATVLNDAARRTYAPEDRLRGKSIQHFVGVGAEWWFNSSRY